MQQEADSGLSVAVLAIYKIQNDESNRRMN